MTPTILTALHNAQARAEDDLALLLDRVDAADPSPLDMEALQDVQAHIEQLQAAIGEAGA